MPRIDESNFTAQTAGQMAEAKPGLVQRLQERAFQLRREVLRIENTIQLLEKNAALVEVVQVVLLAEQKTDRPIPLY